MDAGRVRVVHGLDVHREPFFEPWHPAVAT